MLSHFNCVWLCVTLMDSSLPSSSVHGILQARILEWVAMTSSRGSSQPRDQTCISYCLLHWQVSSLTLEPPRKPIMEIQSATKKKKWNNVICINMDEPREYYTKWSNPNRERQIPYDITSMWEKLQMNYLQNRNRSTDIENKLRLSKGEGGGIS